MPDALVFLTEGVNEEHYTLYEPALFRSLQQDLALKIYRWGGIHLMVPIKSHHLREWSQCNHCSLFLEAQGGVSRGGVEWVA